MADEVQPFRFRIKRSQAKQYRNIHADGAICSATLGQMVFVEFYSEHPPTAQDVTLVYKGGEMIDFVNEDGTLPNAVRETEVGIFLTPSVARNIAGWLLEQVALFDAAQAPKAEQLDTLAEMEAVPSEIEGSK